jgi:ABC-type uncharacterized transport system substrate-binding protein
MRRREFIAMLGGAAGAWPLAARAQRPSIPVIGFLGTTAADSVYRVSAFRDGLKEAGFIDGHNVAIEFRWAENKLDQLPALAADLAQRQVAVIVGPNITMHAARAATSTIPIVFISGGDPIESGLVTNLSRPGGNITGVTFGSGALQPKRLGLLHELVPPSATIAWLRDPRGPTFETEEKEVSRAARELGRHLLVLNAQSVREIDAAFATIVQSRAGALLVGNSSFVQQPASAAGRAGGAPWRTCDFPNSRVCLGRWFDELRRKRHRCLLPRRLALRGAHSQGHKAGRLAGRTADQVRADHQCRGRQGARPGNSR